MREFQNDAWRVNCNEKAIPAIIYANNITSNGYNASLHGGQTFRKKTGYDCFEMEGARNKSEYRQAILYCIKEKYSPIVIPYGMGFSSMISLLEENKEREFILLDVTEVDLANVFSFTHC